MKKKDTIVSDYSVPSGVGEGYYTVAELGELYDACDRYLGLGSIGMKKKYNTLASFERHPLSYSAMIMARDDLPTAVSSPIPPVRVVVMWRMRHGK